MSPAAPEISSSKRRLFLTVAYVVLAITCLLSAALLLSSGRYGLFAPLVQTILAIVWAAIAVAPWRRSRR